MAALGVLKKLFSTKRRPKLIYRLYTDPMIPNIMHKEHDVDCGANKRMRSDPLVHPPASKSAKPVEEIIVDGLPRPFLAI